MSSIGVSPPSRITEDLAAHYKTHETRARCAPSRLHTGLGVCAPVATLSVNAVSSPPSSRMRSLSARLGISVLLVLLALGAHCRGALGAAPATHSAPAPSLASPTFGVVWTPPATSSEALRALARIDSIGANAVRLTRLPSDTVAARAAALGLALYIDLPVHSVSAAQLPRALQRAAPALRRLRHLARRHASVRHVGLAHTTDTAVPRACDVLRHWTQRIRGWTPPMQTYVVTPFSSPARHCQNATDQTLLDVRDHPSPAKPWRALQAHGSPVGIGAVGTWVRPSLPASASGAHTAPAQASFLQQTLSQIWAPDGPPPSTLFVFAWQDPTPTEFPDRQYGLHTADGSPRPAASVVRGFYTQTQHVFAFTPGRSPPSTPPLLILLGWALVMGLGLLHAQNLPVRQTLARYFTAPGFYRDALQDGRDRSVGTNALLWAGLSGAVGIVAAQSAHLAAQSRAAGPVLSALPASAASVLAHGLSQPLLAGGVASLLWLLLLGIWGGSLGAAAYTQSSLALPQLLALVAWPCWPLLLAPPLALATGPDAPLSPSLFGAGLLVGTPLLGVVITGRVLYDYWAITHVPAWRLPVLFLLSPPVVGLGGLLAYAAHHALSIPFLWRLATLGP